MPFYDKHTVIELSQMIKSNRPDLWKILVENESADGIYTEDEEQKMFKFILESTSKNETVLLNNIFFGIRCFVSYHIGLNAYKQDFSL
jgi:hypothetical protein